MKFDEFFGFFTPVMGFSSSSPFCYFEVVVIGGGDFCLVVVVKVVLVVLIRKPYKPRKRWEDNVSC